MFTQIFGSGVQVETRVKMAYVVRVDYPWLTLAF